MFMRFLGIGIGHRGQHTAVEPDPAVDTMDVVVCLARPQAVSRAKPGQNRPGQAGPK